MVFEGRIQLFPCSLVSKLKIKDVTIDEVQNKYKIGNFGALFMRIQHEETFHQP